MAVNSFADKLVKKIFGSSSDVFLKNVKPVVAQIQAWEPALEKMSDDELKAQTPKFKEIIQNALNGIDDKDERRKAEQDILHEILPEAFATVREASKRVTGMRHFDVQMIGGIALHQGRIAEMRTGEGKTLVATLPSYLNGLTGRGVNVVTVNDYLASRDAEWMGKIHKFLGLSVGVIQNDQDDVERKEAYACDITYGTNNEFGFDYLRDNMKFDVESLVQRDHYFAIIDEVDSILIDEARTPLIISGASDEATDKYYTANQIIPQLELGHKDEETKVTTGDYLLDEKNHSSVLTEAGVTKCERLLGVSNLYDPGNMDLLHCVEQALKAHTLYKADHHYVVQDGEVIIVDDFTGRLMAGRRWSDGLHQAVEAKEGVKIERENQTLATITLQNYFRMYEKLGGMTGTAETEAEEFLTVYTLDVVQIPTNQPMVRVDSPDMIYRTLPEKWDAVVEEIQELHAKGQPVLVGTVSVENSELVAAKLKALGVPHKVLNAKYHEQEAEIIAQAGRKGAVTIATNMAGRGTDILLGGNPDSLAREYLKRMEINPDEATEEQFEEQLRKAKAVVKEEALVVQAAGGLHILGTERHESRRIDNQLRGRAGRQGDPGSSRFVLSLEDDLMRIFGSERLDKVLSSLGMKEGEAIIHPWVNKSLERAQAKVEGRNFDIRKQLLKFDDVMNDQRKAIFGQRLEIMSADDIEEIVEDMRHQVVDDLVDEFMPPKSYPDQWDTDGLTQALGEQLTIALPVVDWAKEEGVDQETVRERIYQATDQIMVEKTAAFGVETMRQVEKQFLLQTIDQKWREHLVTLEHLRSVVGFRGYAQRDPLSEYKTEAFALFENLLESLRSDVTRQLSQIRPMTAEEQQAMLAQVQAQQAQTQAAADAAEAQSERLKAAADTAVATGVRATGFDESDPMTWGNPSRNDACPCGSGEKFKHCHGRLA